MTEWIEYTGSDEQIAEITQCKTDVLTRKLEGDKCTYSDCDGLFEYIREGQCSCHISPPCSNCVDAPLSCNKCGAYSDEDNEQ